MQMEKAVFLSAFIVRKLLESQQLSMQAESLSLVVLAHEPATSSAVPDAMHWDQVERYYDLEAGREETVLIRDLMNWLVHSFTFIVESRSDRAGACWPSGFYCNSDRTRRRSLIRVDWADYRQLLASVAGDDVVSMTTLRNGKGDMRQLRSNVPLTEEQVRAFHAKHASFIQDTLRDFDQSS